MKKLIPLWIICCLFAAYIRLYPLWGHMWSDTNEQATLMVIYNLRTTFLGQIHAQFPEMPMAQAQQLAAERLNNVLHKDSAKVRSTIERISHELHQKANKTDTLYLLESDPYYYYYLTENVLEHGQIADKIKGNRYFEPLMKAPFGYWQPFTIHPYIGVLFYKIGSFINAQLTVMEAVAYVPIVISFLVLAAFIWCARLLGLGLPSIAAGCLIFSVLPLFLKRSSLGWYDTDPYNLLFSFLFLGIFFKTLTNNEEFKRRSYLLFGAGLSLILLLYSLIWQGWVFLYFMTLICAATIAAYEFIFDRDKTHWSNPLILSGSFLLTSILIGSCIYGITPFFSFFTDGASELAKFTVKGLNLWPNLFLEVGELKKSSPLELVANTGFVFLLFALLGLVYGIRKHSPKIAITAIFALVSIILTLKAERFALFTLVPLSLLFAMGIEWILLTIRKFPQGKICEVIFLLVFCCGTWSWANASIRTVLTPIFNSAWDTALKDVRSKTPPESIINTWWPPGHFIKAIARRAVPFDGASLDEGTIGYWMANALLSTDENKSRGILRMINQSGNKAVDFLTSHGLSTSQAVSLLHTITAQSVDEARSTLAPHLDPSSMTQLLKLTHGGKPHSYVLIYNEMVDLNIGLVFTARRNFQKIEQINANPSVLKSMPPAGSQAFIDFLWDIAGGPSKYSEAISLIGESGGSLIFNEGITVQEDFTRAKVNSPKYGQGIPASIVFQKDGQVIEQEFANATLNYSIVVYTQDGSLTCRLMDKALANALIMKMHFFNGTGLRYFKPFTSTHDLTGRTQIKVFEVLWD